MKAGSASADITPSRRLSIAGQLHVRYGEYAHDPLTVNAVAFEQKGMPVALVSCDLCLMPDDLVREIQAKCEEAHGIPAASVIVGCTHTHVAPLTADVLVGDVDPAFVQTLVQSVVSVVGRALADLDDVDLYAGAGWLDQMGFNRRGYHSNGTVDMYYGCWNDDYAGLEGPRDGEVGVIFGRRPDGTLKFVIPSFATHPNSLEGESFYSADVVGAVRNHIRTVLGGDVDVIYLTGAAGDTAPTDLDSLRNRDYWRGEEGWIRSGLYLGSEIIKVVVGATTPMADPEMRLEQSITPIPIREYNDICSPDWLQLETFRRAKEEWPRMIEDESPVDVRLNVLRLGDAAICTSPTELYVTHGLAIKAKSPANVTLISELTDGYVGYVPTTEAFTHGGYSTWPAATSKLREDAGDIIAAVTTEHLMRAFEDKPS